MNFYQNIQISNWRSQSNYPFTDASTLLIDKHIFPVNWILSLNLVVTEGEFPLYISKLATDAAAEKITMSVTDNSGNLICSIILSAEESLVLDKTGRLSGGIATDARLFPWLKRLLQGTVAGTLILPSQALILCSQVITCGYFEGYSGIKFNGKATGPRVLLNFQRSVQVTFGRAVRLDVFGDYDFQYQRTPKIISVNEVDLKNKTLIIKHRKLSDLRTVTDKNSVTLVGVTDAT